MAARVNTHGVTVPSGRTAAVRCPQRPQVLAARCDGLHGWSNPDMMLRYQHVTDVTRKDIAKRLGDHLWDSGDA